MASHPFAELYDEFSINFVEFINSLPIGIYRSSVEGKVIYCNPSMAQIFGFNSVVELMEYPIVNLYRNKKERGALISLVIEKGRLDDVHVPLQRRDGTPIWCSLSISGVYDKDGDLAFVDGVMREITSEREQEDSLIKAVGMTGSRAEFSFSLSLDGKLFNVEEKVARSFGYTQSELENKGLMKFIDPAHQFLFAELMEDVLEKGSEGGIMTVRDKAGSRRHLEFHATLILKDGEPDHIYGLARDITEAIERQKERLSREKFQGVLEMAGGVVHRLNQPLTIINNLVNELIADCREDDPRCEKLLKVHELLEKLNEIAKKVGNIKKYEAMDYVAGVRIVDIDKSS